MIEINNKKLCERCFSVTDAAETCPCCGYNQSEFTPDPMVLPLGTKLNDKIVIGRVMGKGGFGITYLGYDLRMDKTIAVKEYYPNGISYRAPGGTEVTVTDAKSAETFENGAEKFYTEAEMVSQFNGNPNIVSVYDYFRANNTVYLIMEYLSGITLKNYVKKHGKLTDGQALYVMDKIAAALSITHSAGVLHRDISPDNIIICGDGKIKLIDFGAARQIFAESSSNLTVVMKPGYTPIEQYTKKGRQGAWTDIYSLGVSMYYALTKVIIDDPYARMDSDEEFGENKYKINESLWEILRKCTMINASDRYGSAIDLRKALKSVSAPLEPEMIELSDEDLKDEPEEKVDAAAHDTDDDIPATVIGSDPDIAEEIEIFESSAPDESIGGVPYTSYVPPAPVTAEETKPSNKNKLIAAICSAALVIAVGVICVVVGISKQKPSDITSDPIGSSSNGSVSNESSSNGSASSGSASNGSDSPNVNDDVIYSPSYPEMKDGKLFFETDSSFGFDGSLNQISIDNFMRFDGDVKVSLELEHLPSTVPSIDEWGDRYHIRITDSRDQWVEVMAFNKGINVPDGNPNADYYEIAPEQTEFSFVISRLNIDKMSGDLKFFLFNMFIKSAVLEAYDPAELEPGKDAATVNISSRLDHSLSNFIPLHILSSFDSDVKITLDIEYEKMDTENPNADIKTSTTKVGGTNIVINVENNSPMPWQPRTYKLGSKSVPDKFIFTLSKSEIETLEPKGLAFHGSNLYIKTAYIEAAE